MYNIFRSMWHHHNSFRILQLDQPEVEYLTKALECRQGGPATEASETLTTTMTCYSLSRSSTRCVGAIRTQNLETRSRRSTE